MKKGFTLIELLAVIVILAIIALIATPIVLNIINNVKESAAVISAENYLKAIELSISKNILNNRKIEDGIYIVNSKGNLCYKIDNGTCENELVIDVKNEKPNEDSTVEIRNSKIVYENTILKLNNYSCFINKSVKCIKADLNYISTTESSFRIDVKEKKFLYDYRIYGNSLEEKVLSEYQQVNLPSEYQQVDYIESTSTQYIDTEVAPSDSVGVYIDFQPLSVGTIFGAITSQSVGYYGINMYANNNFEVYWESSVGKYSSFDFNTKYLIKFNYMNNKKFNLDNNEICDLSSTNNITNNTIHLFKLNEGTTEYTQYISAKLYRAKVTKEEDIIRDFIPCYRKSDNVIGLYDLVNNVFYENAGTGTFLKGNDVLVSDTPIEIESVGEYDSTTGKYKIPVTVRGKNYFVLDNVKLNSPGNYPKPEKLANGFIVYHKYAYSDTSYTYIAEKDIDLKLTHDVTSELCWGRVWGQVGSGYSWSINSGTVLTLKQGEKLTLNFAWGPKSSDYITNGEESATFTNIRLEEVEPITTNIYLDEPLRKVGDYVDYIDFINKRVVRNVEVTDEELLKGLSSPKIDYIELPEIKLYEGINYLEIDTRVKPSKIEIKYYE